MAKSVLNSKTQEVRRLSDDEAQKLVQSGRGLWKYIGKTEGRRIVEAQQRAAANA